MSEESSLTHAGFTLVEVILTVAIFVVLIVATTPAYTDFTIRFQLDTNGTDLQQLVRTAQNLAMASREDSVYGVHLVSGTGGSYTLFKGNSYATRDLSYDEIAYDLPNSISLSDTISGDDVTFTRVEGTTSTTGTITLTSTGGEIRTVSVNAAGAVELD